MRKAIIGLAAVLLAGGALAQSKSTYRYEAPKPYTYTQPAPSYGYGSNPSTVYVSPTVRSDGTYVNGHARSAPNDTKLDNWSTKGNVNPYTGKAGTKDPYKF